MFITIYDKAGGPKIEVSPNNSSIQDKGLQTENILSLSFIHYDYVILDVDDYVDFDGERYWLCEKYRPKQKSSREWEYNLKLHGVEDLLKNILVIKKIDNEENPVFTLTASPREHVALIVNCLNDGLGNVTDWKVGQVDGSENIVIDYFGKYCDVALREIAEKVGAEYWIEGQMVNVCRCEHGEPIILGYDKGLTAIEPDIADNVKFYTRLYPVGSTRNINPEKYGFSRLQLPDGEKYVEVNADKYGRVDHYEEAAFSDIYPRRIGKISSVRSEVKTGEDGKPFAIYYFRDDSLSFDPNKYEIAGLVKRISFQEGSELAGLGAEEDGTYYFEVNFNSDTREFEIITIWPYDEYTQLPGGNLVPKQGDKYILWNISMPDEYYSLAEGEFRSAVDKYNKEHGVDITIFKARTDHVWIENNNVDLYVGRRVRLESTEYFPEIGYRDSRITRITRKISLPTSMDIEIGDALGKTSVQTLTDSISDTHNYSTFLFKENSATLSSHIANATVHISASERNNWNNKLDKAAFDELFEKVTDANGTYIRAKYTIASDVNLVAYQNGSISGSGGGGGIDLAALESYLTRNGYATQSWVSAHFNNYVLTKAAVENVLTGNITSHTHSQYLTAHQSIYALTIQRNGTTVDTYTPNSAAKTINITDVASAATLSAHTSNTTVHITAAERTKWNKVVTDFAAITGTDSDTIINKWEEVIAFLASYTEADTLAGLLSHKVDKVPGYGLSENDFTDAFVAKLEGIEAGANKYVHPTATATTVAAANGKVLSAITVNGLGHVTSVASKTLGAADIPSLAISKITGLQTALDSKLDKAAFDELFEKVTDANGTYIRAKYTVASDDNLVAYRSGSVSGGAAGGGLNLAALEAYLTQNGYATQSWVNAHFNNYVLTKAAVENVLTGNITSHTHSQYLTAHQSLANYLYFSVLDSYVAARFPSSANIAKKAADTYIEFWQGNAGWFNFQTGWIKAKGKVEGTSIVKTGGTSAQFLKADGSVDSNSYALSSALGNYVTVNTGQMISGVKKFGSAIWFYDTAPSTSGWGGNAGNGLFFAANKESDPATNMAMGVVSSSAAQDGVITGRYMYLGWGAKPYTQDNSLAVCKDFIRYKGHDILHGGNYTSILDSRYVTALGTSGNYLTWTKNGIANNITVPFATAALSLFRNGLNKGDDLNTFTSSGLYVTTKTDTCVSLVNGPANRRNGEMWLEVCNIVNGYGSQFMFARNSSGFDYWMRSMGAGGSFSAWEKFLTDTNYAAILDTRYYTEGEINTKLTDGSVTKLGTSTVGGSARPIYLNAGVPTQCAYAFGNGSGNAAINNGTVNNNLNADMVDGLHKDAFNAVARFGTTTQYNTGYYKIKIKSADGWMLGFKILAYQYYTFDEINISGYNFGANHWYSPSAGLVNSQGNSPKSSIAVVFGYDSAWNLWVAIPANQYAGIAVTDVANGYRQVANIHDLFEIVYEETLTGTVQKTVTASRHALLTDNVASATKLADNTAFKVWGQTFFENGKPKSVSGSLTGVDDISSTYYYINNSATNPYLRFTVGSQVYYCQATANGISIGPTEALSLLVKSNGNVGIGTTAPSYKLDVAGTVRSTSMFIRDTYGGNSWNAGYGAYNTAIIDNDNQTPLMVAFRAGHTPPVTGADRLFALELLNRGDQLRFAFGGVGKFSMESNGRFFASSSVKIGNATLTYDSANDVLRVDKTLVSSANMVAFADSTVTGGTGGTGGKIQTVYTSQFIGDNFSDASTSDTFNAYTINKINTDLSAWIAQVANTAATSYVKKAGDVMTGALTVPRVNINAASSTAYLTADTATNAYLNVNNKILMVWDGAYNSVRSGVAAAGTTSLGTSAVRWANVYANTINVSSTALVSNLNADLLDGKHAGVKNGNVAVFVSFPGSTSLINAGYLESNYAGLGHPDDKYFKALCKWAIATYPGGGILMGTVTPNSAGYCHIYLYAGKGSDGNGGSANGAEATLPYYCQGTYYRLQGVQTSFGTIKGMWEWNNGCFALASDLSAHTSNTTVHITAAERTKWNKVVTDFAAITGTDSDTIINKWEEVIAFLASYTEADTLAGLLSHKVDKVPGYGLSENDFTDALAAKLDGIEAGANKYVHPTATATTVAAANGKVLSAITVNGLGHVTSVASKTLGAADIPSLAISKITGLQTALDSKLDKAAFDELFEKVTDANGTYIRAKYTVASDDNLVAYRSGSVSGGAAGGGLNLAALEAYLTQNGYATQSWVNAHFNNYVLTKAAVENVLTGNITSHTHSQYLTAHQSLDHIKSLDTRSVQTLPNSYGAQLRVNFKYNSTNDLADGGSYNTEMWIKGYGSTADMSGGYPHQLGFTANGNIWHRIGTSATAWSAWHKLLDSNNYATTLDSRYYTETEVNTLLAAKVNKSGDTMTGKLYLGTTNAHIYGNNTYGAWLQYSTHYLNVKSNGLWHNNTYKIWDSGNDGAGSGLDADLLDGLHYSAFARADQWRDVDLDTVNGTGIMCCAANASATSERHYPIEEAGAMFYGTAAYGSANQIYGSYNSNRWFARGGGTSTTKKTVWREFAFTDGTIANANHAATASLAQAAVSAGKLSNARSINGTAFDGTADITTAKWGTARAVSITDSAYANEGAFVNVDGSANITIPLPSEITATLYGNAATASALQTARTIWGQSFKGDGNVSGSLSSVADIIMTGAVSQGNVRFGHNGSYAEIKSGGNELLITTHGQTTMYVNYRSSAYGGGAAPAEWRWYAGNATEYASHIIKSLVANGAVQLPYASGSWLSMATRDEVIKAAVPNSTNLAHALLRIGNSSGSQWVIGGANKEVGIYGFFAEHLAQSLNYPSWQTVWNVDTGEMTHTGPLTVQSLKIGNGTITWDAANNVFVFSHSVVSNGNLVAYKQ